jgi:hypothetical protein
MSSNYDDRRAFLNPSSLSDPEVARLSKRVFVSSLLVYGFSTAFWLWASANSYMQDRWDWGEAQLARFPRSLLAVGKRECVGCSLARLCASF